MGSAVLLRDDFDGAALRQLARQTKDANQARRLLALAAIYDGSPRSDAARIGSVTLQIVRDWVLRFNARGPDGLVNGRRPSEVECRSAPGSCKGRRERPDPCDPRCCPLAAQGPGPVDIPGIPHLDGRDDGRPRVEGARLCQAVGSPTPLRSERAGSRSF